ncbi:MAG: hypothetical protein OXI17_01980 [Gammaproteobacteria bacterium]|nr:hypothetical protein [Gammaproteobacteria bacterium]MDE0478722.1 hypothetical protein [Gammaproteobacteria bacterium]MDE0507388.1 hypothetical protein [Gammaproteobacteria bacterium]
MKSFASRSFWEAYRRLPPHVRQQARNSYRFFIADSSHPSLEFKRVGQRRPVYSARVSIDYRALGVLEKGEIVWFWIGPHHQYGKLLIRNK